MLNINKILLYVLFCLVWCCIAHLLIPICSLLVQWIWKVSNSDGQFSNLICLEQYGSEYRWHVHANCSFLRRTFIYYKKTWPFISKKKKYIRMKWKKKMQIYEVTLKKIETVFKKRLLGFTKFLCLYFTKNTILVK